MNRNTLRKKIAERGVNLDDALRSARKVPPPSKDK
jgi:hypothetical protein